MASGRNGTIYIGVTTKPAKRAYEHREGLIEGFTRRYGCKTLVWYEAYDDLEGGRQRELQIKKWNRQWKLAEIEAKNPVWDDLFETLFKKLYPRGSGGPAWAPAFAGAREG